MIGALDKCFGRTLAKNCNNECLKSDAKRCFLIPGGTLSSRNVVKNRNHLLERTMWVSKAALL